MYFSYASARPQETKLCAYLDEIGPDWEEIAKSLMEFMSDDDVGDWARINGYWSEDYE